jgi:hypothetical protein
MKKVVFVLFIFGALNGCSLIVNPNVDNDLRLECGTLEERESCECSNNAKGTRTCLSEGVWSSCNCGSGGSSANGGKGGAAAKGGSGGKTTGGDGGSKAGSGGSGGKGGSGGQAGSGTKSAIYGDCSTNADCDSSGECLELSGRTTSSASTVTASVCTKSCQATADCPAATSGTARAQCSSTGRQCILSCSFNRTCPTGSACVTESNTNTSLCAWVQ